MKNKYKGDEFTQLYEEYTEEIYRYCYIRLRPNSQIAEDCTHNAFLALFEKLKNGTVVENPRAFLYKTANNFVLKAYRNNEKYRAREMPFDECDRTPKNEQYVIDSDIDYDILSRQIMSILSPDEQKLFMMKFVEGLTLAQIKESLNISSDAAIKRIQRLRAKIVNFINSKKKGDQ